MQIPAGALVMVADGRKMLLFRNAGDEAYPRLEVVKHETRDIGPDSQMSEDEPGTFHDMGAGMQQRSAYENTSFHQLEEDRLAADAADELRRRALAHEYEKLIVVAPPKSLGEMRKHYHKEVAARIVGEIAKDLTGRPTDEIEAIIQQN